MATEKPQNATDVQGSAKPVQQSAKPLNSAKPCPFCGSKNLEFADNGEKTFWVVCSSIICSTEGPWGYSQELAVEKWNDRK